MSVAALRAQTEQAYRELEGEMIELGLVRANGVRDTKAAKRRMLLVCERDGLTIRRTAAHKRGDACKDVDGNKLPDGDEHKALRDEKCAEHVCLDGDACAVTNDEVLLDYAEISTLKKVLSNDVEMLSKGVLYPVHTRYDIAETGRVRSSKPNIMNLRRMPGIRECFVPRPGKIFIDCDYPQLELYALAQVCISLLGESKLAEALNAGLDPHLMVAAVMLGISYEAADVRYRASDIEVADMRQLAKIANFGWPGGMGPPKMLQSALKQLRKKIELLARLQLDEQKMRELREYWHRTWPEMAHYFAWVNAQIDPIARVAKVETLFTKRIRGGANYCSTCNNGFQALGVDCAKEAGWRIAKAQYVDTCSPLYNTRTVAFVHDQFIVEADDNDRAHDAAYELARHMREGANIYLPNVPITADRLKPLLMRRWSKEAKQVFNNEGRLIPWQ